MAKIHEVVKSKKKSPQKSAKEKRHDKREKKAMKNGPADLKKVFEGKDK